MTHYITWKNIQWYQVHILIPIPIYLVWLIYVLLLFCPVRLGTSPLLLLQCQSFWVNLFVPERSFAISCENLTSEVIDIVFSVIIRTLNKLHYVNVINCYQPSYLLCEKLQVETFIDSLLWLFLRSRQLLLLCARHIRPDLRLGEKNFNLLLIITTDKWTSHKTVSSSTDSMIRLI